MKTEPASVLVVDDTPANLALGLFVGFAALRLSGSSARIPAVRPLRLAALALLFAKELTLSAIRVARSVLGSGQGVHPGIVAVPLMLRRDGQVTLLANLITLTPGTLSVEISADRRTLLVHALDASDPAALRRDIAAGFERLVGEAFP